MFLDSLSSAAARHHPDELALVADGRTLTFAELEERVDLTARAVAATTEPGDRVAVIGPNHTAFVVSLLAIPRAGRVLVPLNLRLTAEDQVEQLDRTEPTLLLGDEASIAELAELGAPVTASAVTFEGLATWAEEHRHGGPVPDRSPEDPAWLIFTSGTTSQPKGVLLSHRSLLAATLNTAVARPLADDDVYLFPFPLYHVAAYNLLVALMRARPTVLLPRFEARAVVDAVDRHGVTAMSLAPTMMSLLLQHPDGERTLHGRRIAYGASAIPEGLLRRVLAAGAEPAQGYGMTELSGNAVFLGPAEHRRGVDGEPELLSAAGTPGPLVEVRIVDDRGGAAPTGVVGEILVRGEQVSPGYWRDPDTTAAGRTPDGWFRTGDLGRLDASGRLHIVDRAKDMIVTGGENVASREVEDAVSTHPDVVAVAVVGVPDEHWGERICAVIVPRPGTMPTLDDLDAHLRGRIAGYKRPRSLLLVDELPVNASGKVLKRELRDRAGMMC